MFQDRNSIQSVPVSFGLWDTALKFLSPGPCSDVTDHLVTIWRLIKLVNETLGFKSADDCTIIAPVYDDIDDSAELINQFVRWAGQNRMNSNSTNVKSLLICIKNGTLPRPSIVF